MEKEARGMFHGGGHRRAQQARLTPCSSLRLVRKQPCIRSFLEQSIDDIADSSTTLMAAQMLEWSHCLEETKQNKITKDDWDDEVQLEKHQNLQKSVPLLTRIWNFLSPQLNYNGINFANNNYIFHYRTARKERCKTRSQGSPLSCLCLFVYSIKY